MIKKILNKFRARRNGQAEAAPVVECQCQDDVTVDEPDELTDTHAELSKLLNETRVLNDNVDRLVEQTNGDVE